MSEPFNLEEFRNGRDAITRDGRRAYFLVFNERAADEYKLLAHIDGDVCSGTYYRDGRVLMDEASSDDLVSMAPRIVTWQLWWRACSNDNRMRSGCHTQIVQKENGPIWMPHGFEGPAEMLKEWTTEE